MKVCIDIDGTICPTRKSHEKYEDLVPLDDAVTSIQSLKQEGNYIILYTARNMKTQSNNIGKIIAKQGKVLIDWLEKWEIPFDELLFGKPLADIYIDDKGYKFENWKTTYTDLQSLG
jgi:capsule biosynthesis phosphatase